jgi:hypothetical protein
MFAVLPQKSFVGFTIRFGNFEGSRKKGKAIRFDTIKGSSDTTLLFEITEMSRGFVTQQTPGRRQEGRSQVQLVHPPVLPSILKV